MSTAAEKSTILLVSIAEQFGIRVDEFVSTLILILTGLAAVGLLAKVIVDLIKQVLEPRIYFNRALVRAHMRKSLAGHIEGDVDLETVVDEVETRILQLTTAGNADLLFRMPVEKLISQLKAVTNIALSWPGDCDWSVYENRSILRAFAKGLSRGNFDDLFESHRNGKGTDPIRQYVKSIVDSNLNGLELQIDYWWSVILHILSVLVCIALTVVFGGFTGPWMLFALLAGLFAPFANDLAGRLSGVKNRG